MARKRKEQYKALAVMVIGFAFIGWRTHHWVLVGISAGLLVFGLGSPLFLTRITDGWKWIGEKMGAVTSRVILSIVFIVFLSPIAFFYRLFASRKKYIAGESNFVERNHTYTAQDLKKVF